MHVVGDAHQPLHAIDAFSDSEPKGDHGGNKCRVSVPKHADIRSLHMLWDSGGLAYAENFPVPLTHDARKKLAEQVCLLVDDLCR